MNVEIGSGWEHPWGLVRQDYVDVKLCGNCKEERCVCSREDGDE